MDRRILFLDPPVFAYKPYGFWSFIGDIIMTLLTCGFWLIWIFVREMRRRNRIYRYRYWY